ncbi:Ig-like domain-containing protein, partial [Pontibacter arcticus]
DNSYGIALDNSNNVYITGAFNRTATFGNTTLTSHGSLDIFLAKYDASGSLLWAQRAGGTAEDKGYGIAVDNSDNVYITGSFSGTAYFKYYTVSIKSFSDEFGSTDAFFARYDSEGNVQYARTTMERGNDAGHDITIGKDGSIFITGYKTLVNPDSKLSDIFYKELLIRKYDSSTQARWSKRVSKTGNIIGYGIKLDEEGNIYVTGDFEGKSTINGTVLNSSGLNDIFVTKLNSYGDFVWAKSAGGLESENTRSLVLDKLGNIYIVGQFKGNATFGNSTLTSNGLEDVFVSKLNSSGDFQWTQKAGGLFNDSGHGISLDKHGNVFITGRFEGNALFGNNALYSTRLTSVLYNREGEMFIAKMMSGPEVTGASICGSGSVVLTASGADDGNYRWYTVETGGTAIPNAHNATYITPVLTASTTYYVSVLSDGSESIRTAVSAIIKSLPSSPTTSATSLSYCQGAAALTLKAAGANLQWYTSATGGTGSATAPTPSTATAGTTSYYVSQTVNGCESPRAKIEVTVNALPAKPVITISGSTSLCEGGSVVLTAPDASSYLWSTGDIRQSITVSTAGSYTVKVTNAGRCESVSSDAVAITVNVRPSAPGVTASLSYCQNATASTLAATGESLKWYTQETGGTGASTAPTPSTATAGTTSYYVSQTVNGCESPRAKIEVTVNALPAKPMIKVSGSTSLCEGGSVVLTAPVSASYLWSTGATTQSITVSTTGSYSVKVKTDGGCESLTSDAVTVTVNAVPTAPTVTATSTYCQGAAASTLTAAGANLQWYTSATGGTGSATAPTPSTATVGTTSYYVSQTVNGCESPRAKIEVTVNALPVVTLASFGETICSSNTSYILTGGQPSGGTYSGEGVSNGVFSAAAVGAGTYVITYSYTVNGCTVTATQNITVSTCTGIKESKLASGLSLYPNPTNDRLQVTLPMTGRIGLELRLFDAKGQTVLKQSFPQVSGEFSHVLDLTGKAQGVYLLQLIANDGVITRRVVKK